MKGIVFSEFIELVEDKFGLEIADTIIEKSNLPNKGAYTQVGTYDHHEMLTLLTHLSEQTNIQVQTLVQTFGEHLLDRFVEMYPQFFESVNTCFEFLETIEHKVHVEVKKLYPDAELPTFDSKIISANHMELMYQSKRPFSALAYGLITGSARYYGEAIDIEMEDLSTDQQTRVCFQLKHSVS